MNSSLGLGVCKELEYFCWKNISDNLSFKANDANKNCVGVFISGLCKTTKSPSSVTSVDRRCSVHNDYEDMFYKNHEKFYRIIKLTEELDKKVNLPERFPELNEYVEGKVLSVDEKYRGMGIAGQLVNRTLVEMGRRNISLIAIQCSSLYSARVMARLGFELVAAIAYKDFHLEGRQAIVPKPPHDQIRAFIRRVNCEHWGCEG